MEPRHNDSIQLSKFSKDDKINDSTEDIYESSDLEDKTNEKRELHMSEKGLPFSKNIQTEAELDKWRKILIACVWFSITIASSLTFLAFYIAFTEHSTGEFGLAIISLLNAISSFVVFWRFKDRFSMTSQKKENLTMVILGCFCMLSAIAITAKAGYSLAHKNKQDLSMEALNLLFVCSLIAAILFYPLFLVEAYIARKLMAWTILTDSLNSLAAALAATSLIGSTKLDEVNHAYWLLDPIIGITIGVLVALYAIWALVKYIPATRRSTDYDETK